MVGILCRFGIRLAASGAVTLPMVACSPQRYIAPEPRRPERPLTLDAAVALACDNNPDIAVAREREARAAIDEAASQYWPVLQFVERFTRSDVPSRSFSSILDQGRFSDTLNFNDPPVTSNFRTGLEGGITLYDAGRRRARVVSAPVRRAGRGAEMGRRAAHHDGGVS